MFEMWELAGVRKMAVILLTGTPHIGKTTIIKKVVALLNSNVGGFYTREVQSGNGERIGFEIVTLGGISQCLATQKPEVDFPNQIFWGKYKVNLAAIDSTGVPALRLALRERKIVCVDEIGPMEIFSKVFQKTILEVLNSNVNVIGTIVKRSYEFADRVKVHPRVVTVSVNLENRNALPEQLVSQITYVG